MYNYRSRLEAIYGLSNIRQYSAFCFLVFLVLENLLLLLLLFLWGEFSLWFEHSFAFYGNSSSFQPVTTLHFTFLFIFTGLTELLKTMIKRISAFKNALQNLVIRKCVWFRRAVKASRIAGWVIFRKNTFSLIPIVPFHHLRVPIFYGRTENFDAYFHFVFEPPAKPRICGLWCRAA